MALGIALIIAMIAAVGFGIYNTRIAAIRHGHHDVVDLGMAIAGQIAHSIQAVDLVLLSVQTQIARNSVASPDTLRTVIANDMVKETLRQELELLPQAKGFAIITVDGQLENLSTKWTFPTRNLTDQDYYRYFVNHDDGAAYISRPTDDDADGHWTVNLVRRINGKDGHFLGVILGVIDLDYFKNFFQDLISNDNLSVTLVERGGILLTSFPLNLTVGQRPHRLSAHWDHIVASKRTEVFEASGLTTSAIRIVSVHPLQDYPLVVGVSLSKHDLLSHWRQQTILVAVGSGCALLCMLLLMGAIILQLRRLEQSEKNLAEKSSTLATTVEHINQGIVMVDANGHIAVCNSRVIEMLDLPPDLMASHPSYETVYAYQLATGEFGDEESAAKWLAALRTREPISYERRRPNGQILEVESTPLPDGGVVRTYTDVTERRRSEEQTRYLAHHDSLTHLANRILFQERLEKEILRANDSGRSLALLYLDLDRFKLVNDTRDHGTGDRVLVQIAARLSSAAGQGQTIARTGGDEFAVIVPQEAGKPSAVDVANGIAHAIQEPFTIDGVTFRMTVSIGIAHYPDHAESADDLLRHADIALYEAKAEGNGRQRVFDESMKAKQQWLFTLEQDLRRALELQQFTIVYQPILETLTGHAVGCEALLRWHHPSQGLVPPSDFIPLGEKLGLIIPIGHWVLETACREAATWPSETHVAVNISPVQFGDPDLAFAVQDILARTGLPAHRLTLEVTEGVLLEESPRVLNTMRALRELGIRFSLDDFGMGHSGLGYLRRFSFDGIKIDKLFVQDMVDHSDASAIVMALLAISEALDLEIIAEGVETKAQLDELKRLHCPLVQGHYTGHALPPHAARAFIMAHRATASPS